MKGTLMKWLLPLLMVLTAFWLTGCAPKYHKFGVTVDEWNRDAFECSYAAQSLPRTPQAASPGAYRTTVYSDPSMGWFDAMSSRRMLDLCMKARGYTRE
jgi:hypothetical protein